LLGLDRKEHHADAVGARLRQGKTQIRRFARKKIMWDLDQNTGAVAGSGVAAARSAVRQVDQDLNSLRDDLVRFLAVEIHDETHAAGIVLVAGVV
jgi:hypothetical protein